MEQTLADLVKVGFLTGALCVAARSCPVERPSVIRPAGAQWVPIKITGPKAAQILGEPLDYASVESYAANAKPDTTALLVDLPSLKTQTSLPLVYKQPIVNYATKDLSKDTECVLLARMLFGEARNCSDAEKRAIASTALHRVNQGGRYGNNLHAVLLKPKQYSCFNEKDPNFAKLKDPLKYDAKSFERCLLIAGEVLAKHYVPSQSFVEKTCGLPIHADHYHTNAIFPSWAKSPKLQLVPFAGKHKFYWSRGNKCF